MKHAVRRWAEPTPFGIDQAVFLTRGRSRTCEFLQRRDTFQADCFKTRFVPFSLLKSRLVREMASGIARHN